MDSLTVMNQQVMSNLQEWQQTHPQPTMDTASHMHILEDKMMMVQAHLFFMMSVGLQLELIFLTMQVLKTLIQILNSGLIMKSTVVLLTT